jgi:hypothetical protein
VKDSATAAIVVEQPARLAVKPRLDHVAREVVDSYLAPMIDGLLKSLVLQGGGEEYSPGALLDACFNHLKSYATINELFWGKTYVLFALYYHKSGRVLE